MNVKTTSFGKQLELGQLRIDETVTVRHEVSLNQPGIVPDEVVAQTLKALGDKCGDFSSPIASVLPLEACFSKVVGLKNCTLSDADNHLQQKAEKASPFPLNDAQSRRILIDASEPKAKKTRPAFYVLAENEIIKQRLNWFLEYGVELDLLQPQISSLFNYIRANLEEYRRQTLLSVQIGLSKSAVILIRGDRFQVREIPIGGASFTKELQKGLKLNSFKEAEELKLNVRDPDSLHSPKAVFQAMRPVFIQFRDQVEGLIEECKAKGLIKEGIDMLTLIGGGAKMSGLKQFLAKKIGLVDCNVDPKKFFTGLPDEFYYRDFLQFEGATSAAMQLLGYGRFMIDMRPNGEQSEVSEHNSALGIDIGQYSIKAVKLSRV